MGRGADPGFLIQEKPGRQVPQSPAKLPNESFGAKQGHSPHDFDATFH